MTKKRLTKKLLAKKLLPKKLLIVVLAAALLLVLGDVLVACPTCKDSLSESDPQQAGLVRGYFWSILFMMSMPFLILAGLSTYFYVEVRRARARGEAGAAGRGRQPAGA